jgi:NTE family protein
MKRIIFLVLLVIFSSISAISQKVAVVLSGGGAKGVTHIGVLRALEENGIPIDYIAGTSMGAIIGGLYASGFSPDQMELIISSNEFSKWVSGKLDPEYSYFFRKESPDPSWLSFKFKYDSILQTKLPTNIVSPIRMDFAFLELFSEASAVAGYDFNKLMIPFRCVASDIRYNSPYILRKGDLGSAIRASMTFPFYFKPIRIDGRLLFDGGMYNNFPADVAMEDFSPDIIIGSKAAGNYDPPKEDEIVSQLSSMLMGETKFNVYCDASVLIEPRLKDVNVIDFSNTEAFIDSGYVATKRLIPQIRQFVIDTVSRAMHDTIRKKFNSRKPDLLVNSVEVHGLEQGQSLYVANAILGQFRWRKSNTYYGHDLTLPKVKAAYFKILGEDRLRSTYPTLVYDTILHRYKFVIDAQYEKAIDADFGGSLSSGGNNEIFLQLKYRLWDKAAYTAKINGSFGRFYNSALVGGRIELAGKKPKYLEATYTFNQFNYYKTGSFFFVDDAPSYLRENNTYLRLDMGFPVTSKGRIEAGLNIGLNHSDYFQSNTASKEDKEDKTKFNYYSPYVELEMNTLNRKQYSDEGFRLYSSIQFVDGVEKHYPGSTSVLQDEYRDYHQYFILKFQYDKYFRTGKKYKPAFNFEMQINTLESFRNYTSTTLYMPAYMPLYQMATRYQPAYRPSGFIAMGMRNVFTVSKNLDLRAEGFGMVPFRELSSNKQQVVKSDYFQAFHFILSGSLVYNTPIGPLSASFNYYDDESPLSFFINVGYIIFNRPAF